MASSTPPKVGIILGGGGGTEGFPQIIQLTELLKFLLKIGVRPDDIYFNATSVGTCNLWKSSLETWQERINSHNDIFCVNPKIQAALMIFFKSVPVFPWKHKHNTWKELVEDYKLQLHNVIQGFKFFRRAYRSVPDLVLGSENSGGEFGKTFLDNLLALIEYFGLDHELGALDLSPLIKILGEQVDENDILGKRSKLHIMTRSETTAEEHIFTNKEEDLAKGEHFHLIDSKEKALLAIRAAISWAPVFAPVSIDGALYCDDGTSNPFPASYAFDEGCEIVFALVKDYSLYTPGHNILTRLEKGSDADIKRAYLRLKKEAETRARVEGKKLYIIHPTQPIHQDLWLLGLSPAAKEYTTKLEIETMQKETQKWLEDNLDIDPA
ncbi:MAG: hypothetical protein Q7R75_02295 [bacterium]|nr:hypothetical protein [bacterium]